MKEMSAHRAAGLYLNPVYPHSFPDPFVLKHGNEYWAYCSGVWRDNTCFGVLRSRDLVHWEEMPGAMDPLPDGWTEYWAPEVIYWNGTFFLYYSVGDEEHMHIRVATSTRPGGPFADSGRRLTHERFAIDAHVFTDFNADRYLFYATDFLEHDRIGTGTVCDRMLDPFTLAGQPTPVTRAKYDWQIYNPHRIEKGGVRWHTLEGPFVLRHKGRYYQMFSGGNWHYPGYGVSYAVTDTIPAGREWEQSADGEQTLPILHTVDDVIGPGHNSVVMGPDNQQLFCVYHRWINDERVMAIDRLEWNGDQLVVLGPTATPQPTPILPALQSEGIPTGGTRAGTSLERETSPAVPYASLQSRVGTSVLAMYSVPAPAFVGEVWLRASGGTDGPLGIALSASGTPVCELMLAGRRAIPSWRRGPDPSQLVQQLPADVDLHAWQCLRMETQGGAFRISLAGTGLQWEGPVDSEITQLWLVSGDPPGEFGGLSLTGGWQDLFISPVEPATLGWQSLGAGRWSIQDGALRYDGVDGCGSLVKGPSLGSYELVVNARVTEPPGLYGFYPATQTYFQGPLVIIRFDDGWVLVVQDGVDERILRLPAEFDPTVYQQFRFRKNGGKLDVSLKQHLLGTIQVPTDDAVIGLHAQAGRASFDAVRVTAIPSE